MLAVDVVPSTATAHNQLQVASPTHLAAGSTTTLKTIIIQGTGTPPVLTADALSDITTLAKDSGQDLTTLQRRYAGQEVFEARWPICVS